MGKSDNRPFETGLARAAERVGRPSLTSLVVKWSCLHVMLPVTLLVSTIRLISCCFFTFILAVAVALCPESLPIAREILADAARAQAKGILKGCFQALCRDCYRDPCSHD